MHGVCSFLLGKVGTFIDFLFQLLLPLTTGRLAKGVHIFNSFREGIVPGIHSSGERLVGGGSALSWMSVLILA